MSHFEPMADSPLSSLGATPNRGWIIFEGILFIVVGTLAILVPFIATMVLTQFIGILCVIVGVFTLGGVIFNKAAHHHLSSALSGLLFLAAGLSLLLFPLGGVLALTLIVAILFVAEGISSIAAGILRRRSVKGWQWLVFNGLIALALGLLILCKWPLDATGILGLLFGIQLLFAGWTFVMIGFALPKNPA